MERIPRGKTLAVRDKDRQLVKSGVKLFEVLEFFSARGHQEYIPFHQVTAELRYPKTTIYRLLYSLEKLGYLEKGSREGEYRLGQRYFDLIEGRMSDRRLKLSARKSMEELSARVHETVNLGVLENDEVLILDVVDGSNPIRWQSSPGERCLLHSTALGKAIAAFLPELLLKGVLERKGMIPLTPHTITEREDLYRELRSIRQDFVAVDDEETAVGALCFATPVFDSKSAVKGALSVSGPKIRLLKQSAKVKAEVREAAMKISRNLGYRN